MIGRLGSGASLAGLRWVLLLVCAACLLSPTPSPAVDTSQSAGRSPVANVSRNALASGKVAAHRTSATHSTALLPHSSRQKYTLYMLGSRAGTSTVSQTPSTFEGRPALRVD